MWEEKRAVGALIISEERNFIDKDNSNFHFLFFSERKKEKRKKKRLSEIFGAILEYQIYCYTEILYGGGFELALQTCP